MMKKIYEKDIRHIQQRRGKHKYKLVLNRVHACGGWSGNRALERSLALACKIRFVSLALACKIRFVMQHPGECHMTFELLVQLVRHPVLELCR